MRKSDTYICDTYHSVTLIVCYFLVVLLIGSIHKIKLNCQELNSTYVHFLLCNTLYVSLTIYMFYYLFC